MLSNIIHAALEENHFSLIDKGELTQYYIRENGESVRFSILHQMEKLPSPEELNIEITQNAPKSFLNNSAFRKNCDLICIVKLKSLSDFKTIEDAIFSIEEDPYHYKKYVLYYSASEEEITNNLSYTDIIKTISDKQKFDEYKSDPLAPSIYSIAAKIFIKLPFLQLPFKKRELVPLKIQAQEAVDNSELTTQYELIQRDLEIQTLIETLVNHELENISN
ncbi:ABC-three component system middle component 1 [Chitinimonas koreensis]|uniref:ABC-three component system middle component 1 n=1 Tax=Chitinimonas koreensis TaxID=356302 RepID=UPI000684B0D4|nr:ABC-three component system middle component 1 [Chitinimonas koreensis]QNM95110.1 hypothetical protein H9L41_14605 [Chitinimonas koreensis]